MKTIVDDKRDLRNKGFTLIEMMIVVALIGILAAITIPNYQKYILRSHRVEARNIMQEIAQKMQQYYSINRQYDTKTNLSAWGLDKSPMGADASLARYNITLTNLTENTYTIEAKPTPAQAKDECGTFTLNQTDVKTAAGQGSRGKLSIKCWRG